MPLGSSIKQDEICGYDFPKERIQEIVDSYNYDFPELKEACKKAVEEFLFPQALVSELHAVARCYASDKRASPEQQESSSAAAFSIQ